MILLKEWVPHIPEEDKHIAYVGEHGSQRREMLLVTKDWKTYEKGYEFYLDLGFDLSSVTSVDQRQMVETQVGSTENISETVVKTNANTTETSYTIRDVQVDCASKTDVVHLGYHVEGGSIRLFWDIAKEHTQLPGHLYATLRAVHLDGSVKKSGVMVFEVDPAVIATPAAKITDNVYQQMEREMASLLTEARGVAETATAAAREASEAVENLVVDQVLDSTSANPVSNRAVAVTVEGLSNRVQALNDSVTESDVRLGDLENMAAEAAPAMTRLEGAVADANLRVAELEEANANLDSGMTVMSGAVSMVIPRVDDLETVTGEMEPRITDLETAVGEVGPRLEAVEQRPAVTVDTAFHGESDNPLANRVITGKFFEIQSQLSMGVMPRLMPQVVGDDTYKILRVNGGGTGYEFIPIQQDAYIQQWVIPYLLPCVSEEDNGKTLQVVDGAWKLV